MSDTKRCKAINTELLEALEALARQCQYIDTVMCQEVLGTNLFIGEPSFQDAIAAIAKAKGESK